MRLESSKNIIEFCVSPRYSTKFRARAIFLSFRYLWDFVIFSLIILVITSCAILSILRSTLQFRLFSTSDSVLRSSFWALCCFGFFCWVIGLLRSSLWCWQTHSQRCLVVAAVGAIAKHSEVQSSVRYESSRVFLLKSSFSSLRDNFVDAICRHRVVNNFGIRPCVPES